jgi:hypothetical protein
LEKFCWAKAGTTAIKTTAITTANARREKQVLVFIIISPDQKVVDKRRIKTYLTENRKPLPDKTILK